MKLSVVIAAYDERDNIEILTRRLDGVLRAIPEARHEIVFVIEGKDGTREIAETLARELGDIRVLYNEKPSGLGTAFRCGFAAVSPDADYVITMDADLNHAPEEIPRLLDEARRRDLDVLIGSRFLPASRTEGIPLWKWWLSVFMNRLIATLFDVEARDKTSGFRVYKAAALARLTGYRNADFAFLPEMLIHAAEARLSTGEAPIHFRFRTRGESKMSLAGTSRSYFALLRSRFDRWSAAALAFLLLGVVVRLLYAFPVHKYVPDADSLLAPIRALDILHGRFHVFYSYVRIGALESYVHAAAYLVMGVTRIAITLAPLFSGIAAMLAFFFFVRELFGRQTACFALLIFAVPSPAFMAWTYMPNGYPETVLLCVIALYLAARFARTGAGPAGSALLGVSAGLAFWNSIQTLVCTVPAGLWLLVRRRQDLVRRPALLACVAVGFVVGALPWIAYNVRYGFPSLRENFAARPSSGLAAVASNARYLGAYNVPELAVGMNPLADGSPLNAVERELQPVAGGIVAAGAALLLLLPWRRRSSPETLESRRPISSFALLWAVALFVLLTYTSSEAGQTRGYTVRYILPLFMVLAAGVGLLLHTLWNRNRALAATVALALGTFYFAGYYLPGTRLRTYQTDLLRYDREIVSFLQQRGIRWVCGNYWVVYPFAFESNKRVLGIPTVAEYDHYRFAAGLGERSVPWALAARDPGWLARWVERTGAAGRIERVGEGFTVFIPDRPDELGPPRETIARLQQAAPWGH